MVDTPTEVMVCIITMRRPEQLRRLLTALSAQVSPGFSFSLLVVDNDKQRSAEGVCAELAASSLQNLQYCAEPEPGIVAARNRCAAEFLESGAAYLAFIDDDEWPAHEDWLASLLRCAREYGADIVAADVVSEGGADVPGWATEILYQSSDLPEGSQMEVFYTGNVLISRAVITAMSPPFDQRFALSGASDYHFALRCRRAGYRAVHAHAPVIEEFPADRATVPWFMRRGFRSGAGHTRSHLFEESAWRVVPRSFFLAAVRCARGLALIVSGLITARKATLVSGLFRLSSSAGTLAGLGGITHDEYRELHSSQSRD